MRGLTRPIAARLMILFGLAYWISISILLFALNGDEICLDTVFPLVGQSSGSTILDAPTPPNPPGAVVAAFWTVGVIVGLPVVVPDRVMVAVLRLSSIAIGICLLASILRLGIMLAPVLALQLLALERRCSAGSP